MKLNAAWRGRAAVAAAVLAAYFIDAFTPLADRIDKSAADWFFSFHAPQPWTPESILLAIDDASYTAIGGPLKLRAALAKSIPLVAAAAPKAIALDVVLADPGSPADDAALEAAFAQAKNLVLPCEWIEGGWEDPRPEFARHAAALGHVHVQPDRDGLTRKLPLEIIVGPKRRWALSLEAFRLSRGGGAIEESPDDIRVGEVVAPGRRADQRALRIRYLPPTAGEQSRIPRVTLKRLLAEPASASEFAGKVVFIGATAQSAVRDRMMTPYTTSLPMPGVEIHAQTYETLAQGKFLRDAGRTEGLLALLICGILAIAIFEFFSGWRAYMLAAGLIFGAQALPHVFFLNGIVFPYFLPVFGAWMAAATAAAWHYFAVQRQLSKSEADKARYQQAIRFVTHEMRTPLSAIQGSSELMNRYNLPEAKRKQMAEMINSESKRLARMIQTFLDVERLGEGEMDLKKEPISIAEVVDTCLGRAAPLAERKSIAIERLPMAEASILGDRELMEYAVYNLLTNAIKYSPADTKIELGAERANGRLRLSVKDQGIGMDGKELKKIFTKFYRTKKAEQSGEVGTGIGLSIVDQIVTHHGGKMEVTSTPGKGSCFTMVLPVTEN